MRLGGVVVRVRRGSVRTVLSRLGPMRGVRVAHSNADGVALVLEAATPGDQEARHREIASWPEVEEASVVFQSSEV